MPRQWRINIRLIGAVLCVLSGLIILWRTFVSPSDFPIKTPSTAVVLLETVPAVIPAITSTPTSDLTNTPPLVTHTPLSVSIATPTLSVVPANPIQPTRVASPVIMASASLVSSPQATALATNNPIVSVPTLTIVNSPTNIQATLGAAVPATELPTSTTLPQIPTANTIVTSTPLAPTIQATINPTAATVPRQTASPSPTSSPTQTEALPTATSSPSPSAIATATTITGNIALYKVQGNATNITIEYWDGRGRSIALTQVALPWELSFPIGDETDLFIIAFSEVADTSMISCSISINGKVEHFRSEPANEGVDCDLPAK